MKTKILILCVGFLLSCGRACSCSKKTTSTQPTEEGDITIAGIVLDADEGKPIPEALVEIRIDIDGNGFFEPMGKKVKVGNTEVEETYSIITTRMGNFIFTLPKNLSNLITSRMITGRVITTRSPLSPYEEIGTMPTTRISISVKKEGYISNSHEILPKSTMEQIKLKKALTAEDDNLTDGIQFTLGGNEKSPKFFGGRSGRLKAKSEGGILMEVDIPKDEIPKGIQKARAEANWVNPISDTSLMPGNFGAKDEKGRQLLLQTAGFVSINITDDKGNKINPKNSNLKTKIPDDAIPTLYDYDNSTTDKVEIPMWWYDEVDGIWKKGENLGIVVDEEDKIITPKEFARIVLGKEKKTIYVKTKVEHFSEWNVDYPIDTHSSICGQLVDKGGNPIQGAHITTQGNTYGGLGDWKGSYTDRNGNFCVDVKRSEDDTPGYIGSVDCSFAYLEYQYISLDCNLKSFDFKYMLINENSSIGNAVIDAYYKGYIDKASYELAKTLLDKSQMYMSEGDFQKAIDSTKRAVLTAIGQSSKGSEQIFWERLDALSQDALNFAVDSLINFSTDKLLDAVNLGEISNECYQTLIKSGISYSVGEINSIIKGEANLLSSSINLLQSAVSTLEELAKDPDTQQCVSKVIKLGAKTTQEAVKTVADKAFFLAQSAAFFIDQGFKIYFDQGDYKAAKAWETVQPAYNEFLRNTGKMKKEYNDCLQKLEELAKIWRECEQKKSPPTAKEENEKELEGNKKRLNIKQITYNDLIDHLIYSLNIYSSIIEVGLKMKNLRGGNENYSNWVIPASPPTTSSSNEYTLESTSTPYEKRGGKERSRILINGSPLKITTDLGVDISDFGSPILPSSRTGIFYLGYPPDSPFDKNPSRWIGKITMGIDRSSVKVKLLSKQGKPIVNELICFSNIVVRDCSLTNTNGEITFKAYGETHISSNYMFLTTYVSQDMELKFSVNSPPSIKITSFGVSNNKISLDAEAQDPDEDEISYKWKIWRNGSFLGEIKGKSGNIDVKDVKGEYYYICAIADDGELSSSQCESAYFPTHPPVIKKIEYPSEITELENANIRVSAEDKDSDEIRYYFYHYEGGYLYSSSSSSAIFYPPSLTQDKDFRIWIMVVDDSYSKNETSITIRVKNVDLIPEVSLIASKSKIDKDEKVTLSAICKYCESYFEWDFDGDGNIDLKTYTPYTSTKYQKYGIYKPRVKAISPDKKENIAETTLKVSKPPYVKLNVAKEVERGRGIQFSLEVTTYSVNISDIVWDFDGDGIVDKKSINLTETFSFPSTYKAGIYLPLVTVIDDNGEFSFASEKIYLKNTPPQISSFSADTTSGYVPLTINFSVSATDDSQITEYIFDFGDGVSSISTSPTISHTYSAGGTFTAKVFVKDNDGEISLPATLQISVYSQTGCPPVSVSLTVNPTSGYSPLTVTFTATAGGGSITQYNWDFGGDGYFDASSQSPTTTKTYYLSTSATITPIVQAINSCGNSATATTTIQIYSSGIEHSSDFLTPITTTLSYCSSSRIDSTMFTIGDINNDGKTDIAYIFDDSSNFYLGVLTGRGDGTFIEGITYQIGNTSVPIPVPILFDFDRDSKMDLIYTDGTSITFKKGMGDGTFGTNITSPISLPFSCYPYDISIGSFDSDNNMDIFVGCSGYSFVATGSGGGNFYLAPVSLNYPNLHGWQRKIVVKDFDGDGLSDVFTFDEDNNKIYLLRNIGGGFSLAYDYSIPLSAGAGADIGIGDFNGDGLSDLVVYSDAVSTFYFFKATAPFSFTLNATQYQDLVPSAGGGAGIYVGDLNSDGVPDISLTEFGYLSPITYVTVLFGSSNFSYPSPSSSYFSSISNAGFNGRPTILSSDFTSDSVPDLVLIHEGCPQHILVMKRKAYMGSPSFLLYDTYDNKNKYGCSIINYIPIFMVLILFQRRIKKDKKGYF